MSTFFVFKPIYLSSYHTKYDLVIDDDEFLSAFNDRIEAQNMHFDINKNFNLICDANN